MKTVRDLLTKLRQSKEGDSTYKGKWKTADFADSTDAQQAGTT
jgi:hypothetical protein